MCVSGIKYFLHVVFPIFKPTIFLCSLSPLVLFLASKFEIPPAVVAKTNF